MDWSRFVGLPWQDRGRGPDGFDCWGLVIEVYRNRGLELPSHADKYASAADREGVQLALSAERFDWIVQAASAQQPCDVALLIIERRFHAGIIVTPGRMLHMPYRGTSVIEPVTRRGKLEGIYRHRGMA